LYGHKDQIYNSICHCFHPILDTINESRTAIFLAGNNSLRIIGMPIAMERIIRNSAGIILILHILTQPTYYPDKGVLAACYIAIFLICLHYGPLIEDKKAYLLAGIRWSAIMSIPLALLVIQPNIIGIPGLIGQKNLFANWIACGMASSFNHPVVFAILSVALMLSGSKTALFYLIILWVAHGFYHNKN